MEAPSESTLDLITSAEAGTLPGLFLRRCERTPQRQAQDAGARRVEPGMGKRRYQARRTQYEEIAFALQHPVAAAGAQMREGLIGQPPGDEDALGKDGFRDNLQGRDQPGIETGILGKGGVNQHRIHC